MIDVTLPGMSFSFLVLSLIFFHLLKCNNAVAVFINECRQNYHQ